MLRSFIDDPTYLIELFTKKEKEIMNFKKKYPIMLLEFEFVILFLKLQHLGANFIFLVSLIPRSRESSIIWNDVK